MPGEVAKVDGYQTTWGGRVVGKAKKKRSKKRAQSQLNLLRGVKHGWKPTGAPARYKRVAKPGR